MFWRRKKTPASRPYPGCFGKLPATGDFIRLNAATEELTAFDRWLGSSIAQARQALGPAFEPAYQAAVGLFVFHGDPKGDEPPSRGLVGAWAASGDNAGRLYPMVVFASYDYGELVETGAALPIALWTMLTSAYELASAGRHMTVDAFLQRVSQLEVPSLEDPEAATASYRHWLTTQPMRALWETGFGTEAYRYWVFQNLVAAVEPFRGHELPRTGLGLRLPLGAGDAYAAAVWMDMTLRLAGFGRTLLNAFWSPQDAVLLHLGPPHVASFREMIAPSAAADHVADLRGPPTVDEPTARHRLGPRLDALVARSDVSLAGFLEALSAS
jgi:type VI secretion system protein ImpM